MNTTRAFCVALLVTLYGVSSAGAYTITGVGTAGGWDDVNKAPTVSAVIDQSDFTDDVTPQSVLTALTNAMATWDSVDSAPRLNFDLKQDDDGNYDAFDGPNDSFGPPWFNGTSSTLDQSAHFRYANVVIGGWLPGDYFGDPNILAVTWSGKLSGDGSRKSAWHSEIFFNDSWTWGTDGTGYDIETVALHELGHALGLGHEDDVPSVMGTYYNGLQRDLFQDDIDGISALYSESAGRGGKGGGGKGNGKPLGSDDVQWVLTGVTYDGSTSAVPEPSTFALLACTLGLVLIGWIRRKGSTS